MSADQRNDLLTPPNDTTLPEPDSANPDSTHSGSLNVGLFVSCLVDLYRPNVGFAAIKLLKQAGCQVTVPESQTCCGQPAYNSGETEDSAAIARATIDAFESFDYIVVPSGSCAGMLREHYPELLKDDAAWLPRAEKFAERVHELTSFLVDVVKFEAVNATFNYNVTYHDGCSGLRELGIKNQPRELLSNVSGLSLSEMNETDVCCGFGGTFCIKYPDISEKMVTDKVALAEQTKADVLLAGDLGCLLNISGRIKRLGKPMRSYHVAEVLADMATGPAIADADHAFAQNQNKAQDQTTN